MTTDDPMARSGARWCDDHNRWECSRNRTKGRGICHQPATRGTATCKNHAGKSLELAKAEGIVNLMVWSAEAAAESDPMPLGDTVMAQLRLAALRADCYGELLRIQYAEDEVDALVGNTYAGDGTGGRIATGEQVRGLARLEAEWRDRVVKYAEAAHRMGIAEQTIALARGQAEIVVAAFRVVLDRLGIDGPNRADAVNVFLEQLEGPQELQEGTP